MKEKITKFFLNDVVAKISYYTGLISGYFSYHQIREDDYRKFWEKAKHGDIVCTVNRHAWISNFMQWILTGAKYYHSAIYDANDGDGFIEATEFGVVKSSPFEFFSNKSKFILLRAIIPVGLNDEHTREMAVDFAKRQIGKPYDYSFDFSESSNDSYYCSELIWKAYQEGTDGRSPFKLRMRFGVLTATPQDIVDARKKFVPIYVAEGVSFYKRMKEYINENR